MNAHSPRLTACAAWLCLLAGSAAAATVTTVDGKSFDGPISALTQHEVRVTTPDGGATVPAEDILSIDLRPVQRPAEAHAATLRSGDVVVGTVAGGSDKAVRIASASLGEIEVPISDVARLQLEPSDEAAPPDAPREKDELTLRNGDSLPGVVAQFDKETLTFDSSLGKVPVPFSRIRSVAFAQVGQRYREPDAFLLLLTCVDGSRLTATDVELKGESLAVRTTLGRTLELPLAQVSTVAGKNGRLVYLSDMEPADVKQTPMFDEQPWPWRRDRSVDGNPITLNGKTFAKGLGVHSRCELTYSLDGKFRRFLSEIGIDDEAEGGNVEVRVEVDAKQVFPAAGAKKLVSSKAGPVPVDVDVSGGKSLRLIVDFGERLHVNDHADWANARLVR